VLARAYSTLRKNLEDERARLRGEIEQLAAVREEGIDYGNDIADDATEAFELTMNLALSQNLADSLRRVEDALQRFDDGSYGTCEDCGQAIELARLKVLPHTRLCVRCVRRHERGS
jgi:DnaK suppressor protein